MTTPHLYLWKIGQRPLLAYAGGGRTARLRAVALFPCVSLKRCLLRRAIQLAIILRLDRFCGRQSPDAGALLPARDLAVLLEKVQAHCGTACFDWLLTWPAQPERQRLYLLFHCPDRRLAGVVKVGRGTFNQRQLRNEAAMLAKLDGAEHPFDIPAVLFEFALDDDRMALALGRFPFPMRPLRRTTARRFGVQVMQHLAAIPVPATKISHGDWIGSRRLPPDLGGSGFPCDDAANLEIEVGFAHGDLGPGNMMRNGPHGLFLLDWENASRQAPGMTDPVAMWLSLRQRYVLHHPGRAIRMLRNTVRDDFQVRLWFALVFLSAHDNLAAGRLLAHWDGNGRRV